MAEPSIPPTVAGAGRLRAVGRGFEALGVPAYRRYLLGASVNAISVWLFQTSLAWVAIERTGSGAAVGLQFIAYIIPALFTMIAAGVITDRIGPRRPMVISQVGEVIAISIGTILAYSGSLSVELSFVLIAIVGGLDGFWSGPVIVMAGRLVEPRLQASALGLSSLQFGMGRIIGGLLGGILVTEVGIVPALAVSAIGPAVAAVVAFSLPNPPGLETDRARGGFGQLVDGASWLIRSATARSLLALGMLVAFFAYSYLALLAILVERQLGATGTELGVLTAATGLGVIAGSFLMDVAGRAAGRGRVILGSIVVSTLLLGFLGFSTSLLPAALIALVIAGLLIVARMTMIALLQALAPARMRGRVTSVFEFVFWGLVPIGGLVGNLLADRFGVPAVFAGFALVTLVGTILVALVDRSLAALDLDHAGAVSMRSNPGTPGA